METLRTQNSKTFISTAMQLEKKGRLEGKKEVAYIMIQENYTNKAIMKCTGLTEKEVEHLRSIKEFQINLLTN